MVWYTDNRSIDARIAKSNYWRRLERLIGQPNIFMNRRREVLYTRKIG
ncbi:MAG: hypothetical protein AB8V79_00480 [Candidatus Midichloria sp.]